MKGLKGMVRSRTSTINRARLSLMVAPICLVGASCRHATSSSESLPKPLPSGIVAHAAGEAITAATLREAARRSRASPQGVLDSIIAARLMGAAARGGMLDQGRYRTVRRAVLSRVLLQQIWQEARAKGPPRDDELAEMTAAQWVKFDRPSAVRTVHVLVRVEQAQQESEVRLLAEKIRKAVAGLHDEQTFLDRARSFPSGNLQVVAESLPPVTADGRTFSLDAHGKPDAPGPSFDPAFAKAANALEHVGAQSGLVRSSFGWHVILLVQRYEAHQVSTERRRVLLAEPIYSRRAAKAVEGLLDRARRSRPIAVRRSAMTETGRIGADR